MDTPHTLIPASSQTVALYLNTQTGTLVLHPFGSLNRANCDAFMDTLHRALNHSVESVIVDLIEVDEIDAAGLEALSAGIELAVQMGKTLSFWSVAPAIRPYLEQEQHNRRSASLGVWTSSCPSDFATFLRRQPQPTAEVNAPASVPRPPRAAKVLPIIDASFYAIAAS